MWEELSKQTIEILYLLISAVYEEMYEIKNN